MTPSHKVPLGATKILIFRTKPMQWRVNLVCLKYLPLSQLLGVKRVTSTNWLLKIHFKLKAISHRLSIMGISFSWTTTFTIIWNRNWWKCEKIQLLAQSHQDPQLLGSSKSLKALIPRSQLKIHSQRGGSLEKALRTRDHAHKANGSSRIFRRWAHSIQPLMPTLKSCEKERRLKTRSQILPQNLLLNKIYRST